MPLQPHLDLRYSPSSSDARHTLDLYLPSRPTSDVPSSLSSSSSKGLIIFVHGGAWCTGSTRDAALAALPSLLPQDHALAVVEYRLSGKEDALVHPVHTQDVVCATEWLVETGADGLLDEVERSNVWLIGHSAGAHMIAHLLLDSPWTSPVSSTVRASFRGFLFSEGIFDIDDLILEYPDYAGWFLDKAFGKPAPNHILASPSNPSSSYTLPVSPSPPKILLSHAPHDKLISPRQTLAMRARLEALGCPNVSLIGDRLGGPDMGDNHDEVLESVEFGKLVEEFVRT